MEREPIAEVPLFKEDIRVLMESLKHSAQRGDVPLPDLDRMHRLRKQLKQEHDAL